MLNLYLAPKSGRVLSESALQSAEELLRAQGIIGAVNEHNGADGECVPGPSVAHLYNRDAHEDLLPAELTFDSLKFVQRPRSFFLPMQQTVDGYPEPTCTICDDGVDLDALEDSLGEIAFRKVERFKYDCPSCRTTLTINQIDFGQTVAVAAQWIFIEGAGTSRLNPRVMDSLTRVIGTTLLVVPEVPEDDVQDWVPAHQRPKRW
ncbi:MAG: hypothetical protein ACI9U2_002220 [Bradymonadia bacterium]